MIQYDDCIMFDYLNELENATELDLQQHIYSFHRNTFLYYSKDEVIQDWLGQLYDIWTVQHRSHYGTALLNQQPE